MQCFVSKYRPLEWNFDKEAREPDCYSKLVVRRSDGRVLGLHYLGPNAGEVTQGYAVAIKMGVTKRQFDETVGIHPTVSEEFTILDVLKGSGEEEKKS